MAKELVFSGEQIIADEAKRLGLVNEVFDSVEKLREETTALARNLAEKPGVAIKLAKKSLNAAWTLPVGKNLELEVDLFTEVFDTEDKEEGVDAFLSKRDPDFSHK
jgi:enoyl-CoA hydratase